MIHYAGSKGVGNFHLVSYADLGTSNAGTVGEAFRGFYSHYGHSYAGSSEQDAAHGLISELEGLEQAAAEIEGR